MSMFGTKRHSLASTIEPHPRSLSAKVHACSSWSQRYIMKPFLAVLLIVFRHSFVTATSSDADHSLQTGVHSQCRKLDESPSQCVHASRGNISVLANKQATVMPDILDVVSVMASEGVLNQSCVDVLTAMACYYIYPPCQGARATQLPVCTKQCRDLKLGLSDCYSDSEMVSSSGSGGSMLLEELLQFALNLNCSKPDSFQVSSTLVDQQDCVTLDIYLTPDGHGSNNFIQWAEIFVIGLGCVFLVLLLLLLLVIVVGVSVCVRRKKRHSKSKVACSLSSNGTTLRRLDSPNPTAMLEKFPSEEEVDIPSDVHVARKMTDRKRRQYVSLYTGSFIPYKHLQLCSVIGEGAFGKVSEGVWRDPTTNTEKRVAIKTLRSFSSEQQLNTLFIESRAMRDFDHPNVMKFLGMCFDAPEGYPYIILPFMVDGSLLDYLKRRTSHSNITSADGYPEGLSLDALFQFCLDIADGMTYLTQQKFVHRDLAARNCMVSETKTILIGDFGLAEDLYSRGHKQDGVRLPVKWMPPESLESGVSNEKTDMWSYGVTCWEVFSLGRSPYPGIENHEILQHITAGGRLKKPILCPDKLYDIVTGCWQHKPGDRPSFHDMTLTLRQFWSTSQPT